MKRAGKIMLMFMLVLLMVASYINCKAEETTVAVDEAHFPDEIFRKYITENIDKDKNGVLSQQERENVKKIMMYGPIYILDELAPKAYYTRFKPHEKIDLQGIQYFTNLEQLSVYADRIYHLSLVEQNKKLKDLILEGNKEGIFDIPKISSLKTLSLRAGDMQKINISKLRNLEVLYIGNVSQRRLKLDLKKNKKLKEVELSSLSKKKSKLDFSKNNRLEKLELNINYSKMIFSKKNHVKKIHMRVKQTSRKQTIKNLKNLKRLEVDFENKDNVREFTVSNCPKLKNIVIEGKGKLHTLNFKQMKRLKNVYIEFGKSLRQIQFTNTPNVKDLRMSGMNIKKVNLNSLKKLKILYAYHCGLKKADLRNLKQLIYLAWRYSKCETMLFKNNKKLENVEIIHNRIKGTLNLSDMSSLWNFNCDHNKIKEIYASKKLKEFNDLSCQYNKLKKINLYHTYVERIYAKHNPRLKVAYLQYRGGSDFHFDKGVKKYYKED